MLDEIKCQKCGGSMTKGFVMELPTGKPAVTKWVEGDIEKSLLTGIKFLGKRQIPLTTYCCENCGYIESYANITNE